MKANLTKPTAIFTMFFLTAFVFSGCIQRNVGLPDVITFSKNGGMKEYTGKYPLPNYYDGFSIEMSDVLYHAIDSLPLKDISSLPDTISLTVDRLTVKTVWSWPGNRHFEIYTQPNTTGKERKAQLIGGSGPDGYINIDIKQKK